MEGKGGWVSGWGGGMSSNRSVGISSKAAPSKQQNL